MQNILVIFTGGTIGSRKGAQGIDVDGDGSYFLLDLYAQSPYKQEVAFDATQPYNILSENLVPDNWAQLAAAIRAAYSSNYAGIIITHGSDTLSFTSAMLSYLCCDTRLPIVLTAGNYPLDDPRSNGLRNFADAVSFILAERLPGVFTLFGNERHESLLYLGTRITQAQPFTDQFDAPANIPFGQMSEGRFHWNTHPANPRMEQLRGSNDDATAPAGWTGETDWPTILYIKPYPGMSYASYDFAQHKPHAVLHDTYHSGTANAREGAGNRSLAEFIRYSRAHGVEVFLVPMRNPAGDQYASSASLTGAGGIPLEKISAEAALMKLMLAYANYSATKDVIRFMQTPVYHEFLDL